MSGCSILTQLHQGFWSGAGVGLGFGLGRFMGDIFRLNTMTFPNFGFGCGYGFGFYGYSTPQIPMPNPFQTLANYSYINNTQSIWGFDNSFNNNFDMNYSKPTVNNTSFKDTWSDFSFNNSPRFDYFTPSTPALTGSKASADKPTGNKASFTATLKDNYNSSKGEKLAKDIAKFKEPNSTGTCAGYVSNALERTDLSNGLRGNCEYMLGYLQQNSNFEEISMDGIDYKNLPAGCILIYDPGSQGYSQVHGHIQVTTGYGSAVSDFETYDIRKPDHILIPV